MEGFGIMLILKGHIDFIPSFEEVPEEKAILTSVIEVRELLEVYKIDNTVNRDLREEKIAQLVNYLDEINTDIGIYIPAIILSYEGSDPEADDNELLFYKNRDFVVLDGQHRIKALERYVYRKSEQSKINDLLKSKVTIQVYFNLTESEKRQLFIEINGKSKKVSQNMSVRFDDRNPINTLVSDLLKNKRNNPIVRMGVEQEKARIVRPGNKNWISMIRLSRFISMLLLGTLQPSKENVKKINNNYEDIFSFLRQFFIVLESALPKEPGNVKKNILGHEAVQNAIALICHEFLIDIKRDKFVFKNDWREIVEMLEFLDWRTNSELFENHLTLSSSKNQYTTFPDSKHYDLVPLIRNELNSLLN